MNIASPTEKAINAMFVAGAKKLKPYPNKRDVDRVVTRLIKDIREARATRDEARKISVMARAGKLLKRAAYATAVTAALVLFAKEMFGATMESMKYSLKHGQHIGAKPDTDTRILGIFGIQRRTTAFAKTMAGMLGAHVFALPFFLAASRLNPLAKKNPLTFQSNMENAFEKVQVESRLLRRMRAMRLKPKVKRATNQVN